MIEHVFHGVSESADTRRSMPLVIFALVFIFGSLLLHQAIVRDPSFANYPLWDSKYRYLQEWKSPPDILLVGNSHIYRHANPEVIKGALANEGHSPEVINLGISDLTLVELDLLLDVLQQKKQQGEPLPGYLVIDPFITAGRVERFKNWTTPRAIRNHTWENSIYLLQFEWFYTDAKSLLLAVYRCASHILSLVSNLFNVGVWNQVIFSAQSDYLRVDESIPDMTVDSGFVSLDEEADPAISKRRLEEFSHYEKPGYIAPYNPNYQKFFVHVRERVVDLGITPVFIACPVLSVAKSESQKQMIADFIQENPQAIFLDYSDLLIQEAYRNSRFWHDKGHLTLEGANFFSKRLGDDLAKLLAEHK